MIYWMLIAVLWVVTRVYFRQIEVVGIEHIPKDGPVIFIGNHPNSLVDPVMILTNCHRKVSFAAKDVLFRNPIVGIIFRLIGAVPIKRRQDHKDKGDNVDNSGAFEKLFDVLRQGGAFGIFPEGISHTLPEIAPLKTGAARIALGAMAEGITLHVVPCGLCYRRRERLRSRVLIQFGEPLVVDGRRMDNHMVDEREAARELTRELDVVLRGLTINASDFETLRVLDGVQRLYRPQEKSLSLAETAELTRRFVAHYDRLKGEPDVQALWTEVSLYLYKLDALGLTDHDLMRPLTRRSWIWRIVRHALFLVLAIPLALPGAIVHAPVLVLAIVAGASGVAITRRKDIASATKMASATLMVLATYAAIVGLIFWFVSFPMSVWVASLTLVGLLASGWALIKVLERQSIVRKSLSVFSALLHLREEIVAMRQMRDRLRAHLLELVDKHYDDDERIIDRDEQRA